MAPDRAGGSTLVREVGMLYSMQGRLSSDSQSFLHRQELLCAQGTAAEH